MSAPYISQTVRVRCIVDGYIVQYSPKVDPYVQGGPAYSKSREEFAAGLTQVKSILDTVFGTGTPIDEPGSGGGPLP